MLSASLRSADEARATLRARSEVQSEAVSASAAAAADGALASVTRGVDAAYDGEMAVEAAMRKVQALLAGHAYRGDVYAKAAGEVVRALKELGDVGSWASAVGRVAEEVAEEVASVAAVAEGRKRREVDPAATYNGAGGRGDDGSGAVDSEGRESLPPPPPRTG